MFGKARTGQMVWVFFREGDPLYPVYFAAAYGEKEWANIRQHTSPDGIEHPDDALPGAHTTINLNGGGIRDSQLISGQAGSNFEYDDFSFEIFGKNGSNLNFTFHSTNLNSKYDFRQQTQGDAHYITGGNRQDRTTGDHAFYCEQDLIYTIGNWSKEAIKAAENIQKVVDKAMKAAKDTYEA